MELHGSGGGVGTMQMSTFLRLLSVAKSDTFSHTVPETIRGKYKVRTGDSRICEPAPLCPVRNLWPREGQALL